MMIPEIDKLLNIIDVTIRSSHTQIFLELEDKSRLYINYHIQEKIKHHINKKISLGIRSDFIYLNNTNNNFNIITGRLIDLKNNDQDIYIKLSNSRTITLHKNGSLTKKDIGNNFKLYIDTYLIQLFAHEKTLI